MYIILFHILTVTSVILCLSEVLTVDHINVDWTASQNPGSNAEIYLRRYGYMETFYGHTTRRDFKKALRLFQRRNGLKETGKLNKDVVNLMDKPRCGYPDIEHRRRPKRSLKKRWRYNLLRWGVSSFSSKLRPFLQWKTFQMAFGFWSRHTPLRFKYRKRNPDVNILFASGEHGDGYYNAFDGEGQILAHAFPPTSGKTHFDEDEPWTLSKDESEGINLLYVSVHEFGHTIGLDHVMDRDAIMSPHTSSKVKFDKLHPHERDQLVNMYGTKEYPRVKPRQTYKRRRRRYGQPPVVNVSHIENPCRKIDDLFLDRYGYAHVFSGKILFNVKRTGQRPRTPNYIRARYAGAPYSPDAVANVPQLNRVYFFKGSYVWRVTRHRVDKEFPKLVPFHRKHGAPRAAVTWTTGRHTTIFLFGERAFWEWDVRRDTVSRPYTLLIDKFWPDLPHAPDAAILWKDQYIYFIKDDKYYKINPLKRRTEKGYPKQMPPPWLAPLCPDQKRRTEKY